MGANGATKKTEGQNWERKVLGFETFLVGRRPEDPTTVLVY